MKLPLSQEGESLINNVSLTLGLIIPARNSMPYLTETIKSLEEQLESPDCIILSDNCSTDGTTKLLKKFEKSSSIAKYVRTPEYLEVGPSFNFGISYCDCDWVLFLHSDDVLAKTAIKTIRQVLSKVDSEVGLVSFKAELIDENSKLVSASVSKGRKKIQFGEKFISENWGTSSINFGAVVINLRIFYEVGGFDTQNSYWIDLKYYHKMVLKYKILRVPRIILRYRTFSFERNSDDRINFAKNNQEYWVNEYLPNLLKTHPSIKKLSNYQESKYIYFVRVLIPFVLKKPLKLFLLKLRNFLDNTKFHDFPN